MLGIGIVSKVKIVNAPKLVWVRLIYFLNGIGFKSQVRVVKRTELELYKSKLGWAHTCMSLTWTQHVPTPN